MSRTRNPEQDRQYSRARDELFSHIHRCGVLQATEQHQVEWIKDTIEYLGERYPALEGPDLDELNQIGTRFCRPVIQRADEPSEEPARGEAEGTADEAEAA